MRGRTVYPLGLPGQLLRRFFRFSFLKLYHSHFDSSGTNITSTTQHLELCPASCIATFFTLLRKVNIAQIVDCLFTHDHICRSTSIHRHRCHIPLSFHAATSGVPIRVNRQPYLNTIITKFPLASYCSIFLWVAPLDTIIACPAPPQIAERKRVSSPRPSNAPMFPPYCPRISK